jgi:hypothetical protein
MISCDINTCKKELGTEDKFYPILLGKKYTLCRQCFDFLKAFIEKRFSPGEDINQLIVTNVELTGNIPSVYSTLSPQPTWIFTPQPMVYTPQPMVYTPPSPHYSVAPLPPPFTITDSTT